MATADPTNQHMSVRQKIIDSYPDDEFIFFDGIDDAIVGVIDGINREPVICYDIEESILALQKTNDWDEETSSEWFWFNIHGAYVGPKTPMWVTSVVTLLETE